MKTTISCSAACFKRGGISIKGEQRSVPPKRVTILEMIEKVPKVVLRYRRAKVQENGMIVGMSTERVACTVCMSNYACLSSLPGGCRAHKKNLKETTTISYSLTSIQQIRLPRRFVTVDET